MKIAIDVSLAVGESAGVGSYTRGLLEGLAAIDPDNEYVLYSYLDLPQSPPPPFPQPPNFFFQSLRLDGEHWEHLWSRADLPPKEALDAVHVLHSPFFNAPPQHHGALVVTIYDVSFLLQPQFHTEANRLHCLQGTLNAALYADRIIVISQQTKRDLMEYFSIPEERIRVIYPAHRTIYTPQRSVEVVRGVLERLGVLHNFILFVGSLEPRKNLKTLLQAYATYITHHAGEEWLVVAGGKGWLNDDLLQIAADLGIANRVQFLGYVPEADLRVLYSAAKLFVYPSIYEGFGLPPLEAMACGAPVITSNTSALPEVVGDAALLIDPYDSATLCQTIQRVLTDDDLRGSMRQRSLTQAKLFSWERAAEETLQLYEEVCPEYSKEARAARIGRKIRQSWEQYGKEDPFWAVLTNPDKKNGGWSEDEFFATGRHEIRLALQKNATLGVSLQFEIALDFGCGPGRLTQALAEHFGEVHGVDIAPSMIEKARQLNKFGERCTYHLNDRPDLRLFAANTFDMVYSWLVLQHMPTQLAVRYLSEFVRVTKPGGIMVFQLPDRQQAQPRENTTEAELPWEFWRNQEPLMLMCTTPYAEVVKVLEEAGARVIEAEEDSHADPTLVFCYYVVQKG